MKIGLVLEGGAMRGMYTAGVLDVFMEEGIKADMVVGVSAGALFGVNFLSGQKGRAIRYNKRFNHDKDYMGLRPLLREGNIVNTKYAYEDVPRKHDVFDDEAYMNSGVPFYAVVTSVDSGKAEYIQVKSVFEQMEVLRASGSMPFVSQYVDLGGKLYLDGGIADSIPFEWMAKQGCDKIIVVLTREMGYVKTPMVKSVVNLKYRKYPKLAESMRNRHIMYNSQLKKLSEWEKMGKVCVIRPTDPIKIGRVETDPEKLQEVYDLGTKDGQNAIEKVKKYIEL